MSINRKNSHGIAAFLLLLCSCLTVDAADLRTIDLPAFEPMPGMKTEWVAEKMIYNDMPMSIRNFRSNRKACDVMKYFESKWKLNGFGQMKAQKVGEDWTLGHEVHGYVHSVQVHDIPGGSEGSLVVSMAQPIAPEKTEFPILPNATMVTHIQNLDLGIAAETFTISSSRSSQDTRSWYEAEMNRRGWTLQDYGAQQVRARQLEYQKGKQLCRIMFMDKSPVQGHRSLVMIHWIKG